MTPAIAVDGGFGTSRMKSSPISTPWRASASAAVEFNSDNKRKSNGDEHAGDIGEMALFGCDVARQKMLAETVKWHRVGSSTDQWLEQRSGFDPHQLDRIALIFGFAGDYQGCTDLLDALVQKYPRAAYRCVPAN